MFKMSSADFFSKWTFSKKLVHKHIQCQTSILIWIQTVCNGYQQTTKITASRQRSEAVALTGCAGKSVCPIVRLQIRVSVLITLQMEKGAPRGNHCTRRFHLVNKWVSKSMADPEGVRGFAWTPLPAPPPPRFWNILWKLNNLDSVRPNYFIFMGYLRKMR